MGDFNTAKCGEGVRQFASYMYGMDMSNADIPPDTACVDDHSIFAYGCARGENIPQSMKNRSSSHDAANHRDQACIGRNNKINNISLEGNNHRQLMHPSAAIPISGKRSPHIHSVNVNGDNSVLSSHYLNSTGRRLGGMAMSEPLPYHHHAGIPMPSPVFGHGSGATTANMTVASDSGDISYVFCKDGGCSGVDRSGSYLPQSPPMSRSLGKSPAVSGGDGGGVTVGSVGTSPRSLTESMFSFRAGSMSTKLGQQEERQKRRKENHNAVERRRRDLINGMISQLALIVTASPGRLETSAASKMNKGEVLEASVRRMLTVNQMVVELAQQLAFVDPRNQVLSRHGELISSLVTSFPDETTNSANDSHIAGSIFHNDVSSLL